MNQAEYERLLKLVWDGGFGPCEKVNACPFASRPCRLTYNLQMLLPKRRWMLCFAWCQPEKMKEYMKNKRHKR